MAGIPGRAPGKYAPGTDSVATQRENAARQAEGTVTKADPTGSNSATGPGADSEKNTFQVETMRFPAGVGEGSSPKTLHWIKFVPCVQTASQYQPSSYDSEAGGASMADRNRNTENAMGAGSDSAGNALAGGVMLTGAAAAKTGVDIGKAAVTSTGKNAAAKFAAKSAEAASKGAAEAGKAIGAAAAVAALRLGRKTRRAGAYIALYMPDTVATQLVNQYDAVSLTAALGKVGLYGSAGSAIAEGDIQASLTGGLSGGGVNKGGLAEAAGAASEATGNVGQGFTDLMLFSAGVAQNPQVEVLFKNISNREFQFDFKLVPKSQAEAVAIYKIIKTFRFHAAPELPTGGNGRYFIPPSEFDITFMLGSGPNPFLPLLSTCVLEAIDVNYGSAGQWTAFEDGAPVEIGIQLRFKEVEIMHKKLIDQGY